jgi:membrane protease YdiL (CAAX protease family)
LRATPATGNRHLPAESRAERRKPRMRNSFTFTFAIALVAAIVAAAIAAPFVAVGVAALGFHFPFPRIFDRVVMVALFGAMLAIWRRLRLMTLLRTGFAAPRKNGVRALRGFGVGLAVIGGFFLAAVLMGASGHARIDHAARLLPKYLLSAIVIGILEEGFFRAFLFGGVREEFGPTTALVASSAFYAMAHLVRAPAHFYVTTLEPGAGFRTLSMSLAQFSQPSAALPTLLGLFLLGIVLAEAFMMSGTVYFSAGLHAGFVMGVKLWPRLISHPARLPGWFVGWGHIPLISGVVGWIAAAAILVMLRKLAGTRSAAV